jgi:hypothetical protein
MRAMPGFLVLLTVATVSAANGDDSSALAKDPPSPVLALLGEGGNCPDDATSGCCYCGNGGQINNHFYGMNKCTQHHSGPSICTTCTGSNPCHDEPVDGPCADHDHEAVPPGETCQGGGGNLVAVRDAVDTGRDAVMNLAVDSAGSVLINAAGYVLVMNCTRSAVVAAVRIPTVDTDTRRVQLALAAYKLVRYVRSLFA